MNLVVVLGREPKRMLEEFAKVVDRKIPDLPPRDLERGEAALWFSKEERILFGVKTEPSRSEPHRHKRKYAEGQLEEEWIFHFCGPGDKLNLRAQNLSTSVQLTEGVDAEAWQFHLKRGDYSHGFRQALKDEELADQIEAVEKDRDLTDAVSRGRIKEAILQKYTAPV